MNVIKFLFIAMLCTFIIVMLKETSKQFAFFASIASACILLLSIIFNLTDVYQQVIAVFEKASVPVLMLEPCIKVISLAYLTEFTANISEDAGEKSIGDKVRLFGKICIFTATIPLISDFIDLVMVQL